MAASFKSRFISLALTLSVVIVAIAAPASGYDDCDNNDYGCGTATTVPVAPVAISPETDFLPINNVRPIVNVCSTEVHDYSGSGNYDCDSNFDGYGHGYGHLGDHDSDYCDSDYDDYDNDCGYDCDRDCY
ncbi:hypothetical protein BGZ98_002326 [Dissophora globulifera]|nr:hypothetical protein BGZ98_002326 [Dissophora globulifera]